MGTLTFLAFLSAFSRYTHLGHLWPNPESAAVMPVTAALLLESGSYLLLEDGVSHLLLE